jgi:hypothetical protein
VLESQIVSRKALLVEEEVKLYSTFQVLLKCHDVCELDVDLSSIFNISKFRNFEHANGAQTTSIHFYMVR